MFNAVLDEKTGTLKLSNLSSNMSGKYVCTASNSAGSESCFINLEVVTCTYHTTTQKTSMFIKLEKEKKKP